MQNASPSNIPCLTCSPSKVRLMTNKGGWGITHLLYFPTRFFPVIGSSCVIYSVFTSTLSRRSRVLTYPPGALVPNRTQATVGHSVYHFPKHALTCGSASHSTNLPKVSALGSLVITMPKSQLPVILFLGMLAAEGMLDA